LAQPVAKISRERLYPLPPREIFIRRTTERIKWAALVPFSLKIPFYQKLASSKTMMD
jgi:hypothetical protein